MSEPYRLNQHYIPERMMPGIQRYVEHGLQPGSFLCAIIQNNLSQAVGLADNENLKNIPAFIAYLYNECPGNCWGSPEKMKSWMDSFHDTDANDNQLTPLSRECGEEGEG